MIQCVVFDFDGVLVDSNAAKRAAYFEIFAQPGGSSPYVEAALQTTRDGDRFQIIELILRNLAAAELLGSDSIGTASVEHYANEYNRICETFAATCREIPGASELFPRMVSRYRLYINSATPQDPLRRIVRQRGWEGYFRGIFGRPGTKAQNLAQILDQEHISGREVVFVGDGQRDLDGATQLGCHFIAIRNSFNDFERQALLMLDDLSCLDTVIQSL